MCSGIGPARHLQEHGIEVIHDNPYVGENLQDHPAAVVSFRTPQKGVSVTSKLRLMGGTNPIPVLQWLLTKTGLLTSTGCDHGAFVRTSASDGQPDLQIRFLAARALGPDGMTTFTQFRSTKNHVSVVLNSIEVFRLTCLTFSNITGGWLLVPVCRMQTQEQRQSSFGIFKYPRETSYRWWLPLEPC